jgi:hypothetical protein
VHSGRVPTDLSRRSPFLGFGREDQSAAASVSPFGYSQVAHSSSDSNEQKQNCTVANLLQQSRERISHILNPCFIETETSLQENLVSLGLHTPTCPPAPTRQMQ